jgi:GMC oxidoreductase
VTDPVECIVVGSGCSGAIAAGTLVDAGVRVTMLDVGHRDERYARAIPARDFVSIRREESGQHRYLIGDEAEGVVFGEVAEGEHITPPRRHIMRDVDRLIPLASETFRPFESLGYGGLGIGWGLGCWEYSHAELRAAGLDPAVMRDAYRHVGDRIGISGVRDDAAAYTVGDLRNLEPPTQMDRNHRLLLRGYERRRATLRRRGFVLGRAPLALLTEDRPGRGRYAYRDMDFYSDADRSAWRPWIAVDELREGNALRYVGGQLVRRFSERDGYVEVEALDVETGATRTYRARRLVLASSALGTARIVLRSLGDRAAQVPLLCNAYAYIPCVQPGLVGHEVEAPKLGFSQLSLFHDADGAHRDVAMASLYSYQSLMLFRIVKQAPIDLADARVLMRWLMSGFLLMGLHQPDPGSTARRLWLGPDRASPTGDRLEARFAFSADERRAHQRRRRRFIAAMRSMGAYALRTVDPGPGGSIHYAGTLPFADREQPLALDRTGRVHGTERVYVADGSGFRYLPAKGLTFSVMANAHLVARHAAGRP